MSERPDPTDYLLGELGPPDRARAAELERDDPVFGADVARLKPLVTRLQGLSPDAWESALGGVAAPIVDRSLPRFGCEVRGRYGNLQL